ncbi:MAG: type IV pilus modification PilV family protein, partial [Bdellovibrionales bacterium]
RPGPIDRRFISIEHLYMQLSLQNQRGQSLVQVLIAAGIMGIILMAMASMQTNQARENSALSQKMAALDMQKTLTNVLLDGAVCTYILNNPAALTFNSTTITPATPQILTPSLPIYASYSVGPPVNIGPALVTVGTPASAITDSLVITSIQLEITGAPAPLPPPGPGVKFSGNWRIKFDNNKLVRPIHDVIVTTTITADTTTPGTATVSSCMGQLPPAPSAISTAEDGSVTIPTGSAHKFNSPAVLFTKGIYQVTYYNCIVPPDTVSASYYLTASAEALSGTIASGFYNFNFDFPVYYNTSPFILKVLSPTASVSFYVQHAIAGGIINYGSFACAAFYYTKIGI